VAHCASRVHSGDVHELAICEAIAQKAEAHADGRAVVGVTVRIGHLRQVVPDALLFSWELVTEFTNAKGSVLHIESVPAVVRCDACGQTTTLSLPILSCARCESFDVTLVSGEEFQVVSMDLADA
jgi:hydrogenase nickel incorporation protein HypA/HybF